MDNAEPAKLVAHEVAQPTGSASVRSTSDRQKRGPETVDSPQSAADRLLMANEDTKVGVFNVDNVPASVPHRRYPQPLETKSYNLQMIDWRQSLAAGKEIWAPATAPVASEGPGNQRGPVIPSTRIQKATISLSLFVELYNASEEESKILRLTTFGSGFSIGDYVSDDWKQRGVFQDCVTLQLAAPDGLRLGEASPKTENRDATFTSTASTTIRVSGKGSVSEKGAGGEGGGELSYAVSSSVSTKLSDFQVLDKSAGNTAEWSWEMTKMGDGDPKYTYPYDGPSSLVNFWGNILPVPGLAKATLFPACQAYWYVPLNFNKAVTFQVIATQRSAYVVSGPLGDGIGYHADNAPVQKFVWQFPVSFDFS